jgi:hypothetical protein
MPTQHFMCGNHIIIHLAHALPQRLATCVRAQEMSPNIRVEGLEGSARPRLPLGAPPNGATLAAGPTPVRQRLKAAVAVDTGARQGRARWVVPHTLPAAAQHALLRHPAVLRLAGAHSLA